MKTKKLFGFILCIALIVTIFSACGNKDQKDDAGKTSAPVQTAVPEATDVPTEEPSEVPSEVPTAEITAEPTAEPTQKPLDGTVDLEALIEDVYGGASVDSSSSITIDVTSSYGDIAYFTLENSENFTLSFRISEFLPTENHQQVGIIIAPNVNDLSVYGKFMRTFSGSNLIESYGTEGTSWDTPDGSGQTPDPFVSSDSIFMKAARNGDKISFFVSQDGSEWTEIHQYDCRFEDDLQIGFTGATFTSAEAHAVIDNVKVLYG